MWGYMSYQMISANFFGFLGEGKQCKERQQNVYNVEDMQKED
jgi:hypothetical protein